MSLFRIDLHRKRPIIGSCADALFLDLVIAYKLCLNNIVRRRRQWSPLSILGLSVAQPRCVNRVYRVAVLSPSSHDPLLRPTCLTKFPLSDRSHHHWCSVVMCCAPVFQRAALVEEEVAASDLHTEFARVVHYPFHIICAEQGAGLNRACPSVLPLGLALGFLVCSHQFSGRSAWTFDGER